MGGVQETITLDKTGLFNALVVSSMMGCTISFTIPFSLGVVNKEQHKELAQIRKIFKLFLLSNLLFFFFSLLQVLVKRESIALFFTSSFSARSLVKFFVLNESPFGGHLWYLGAILYVLLIVFFVEKKRDRKILYPLIPVLLLLDLILGKYSLMLLGKSIPYIVVRNFLFVGLPYFLLGDLLYRFKITFSVKKLYIFSLFFACTTVAERLLLEHFNLNASRDHYISTTFLAVSLFLIAVQYERKKTSRLQDALCFIGAKLSSGIYILHPMFLAVLSVAVQYIGHRTLSSIYSYAAAFMAFFLSILASLILHVTLKKTVARLRNTPRA